MQKISIASDHKGVELKNDIIKYLESSREYEILDLGAYSPFESVDYPDYAKNVCDSIIEKESDIGILICGTGIGMSIAANKRAGIRAALCTNVFMAERSRAHNDANILVIGSNISNQEESINILKTFLNVSFEGGRHALRLSKMS